MVRRARMTDRLSPEGRRRNMQAIGPRDTRIELRLRQALWGQGIRGYRVHCRSIPGRPDVAFSRWRVAVFVDGCFWHGCPECYRAPRTNANFWKGKVEYNTARDRRNTAFLRGLGWVVIRFWGHSIENDLRNCVRRIRSALKDAAKREPR
jgi:DNA mismatch endonuclease (patch repair protein)